MDYSGQEAHFTANKLIIHRTKSEITANKLNNTAIKSIMSAHQSIMSANRSIIQRTGSPKARINGEILPQSQTKAPINARQVLINGTRVQTNGRLATLCQHKLGFINKSQRT